jgi:hypothetical protein
VHLQVSPSAPERWRTGECAANLGERQEARPGRGSIGSRWRVLDPTGEHLRQDGSDAGELGERPAGSEDVHRLLGPLEGPAGRPAQGVAEVPAGRRSLCQQQVGKLGVRGDRRRKRIVAHF